MGKVEKFVVLGVLSLIVVILVVSQTGDPAGASAPGGADRDGDVARGDADPVQLQGMSEEDFVDPWGDEVGNGSFTGNGLDQPEDDPLALDPDPSVPAGGLLFAHGDGPEGAPPAAADGPIGDLITTRYLIEDLSPDLRYYICRDGDTYESIATTYYGDASFARLLRHHNEGRERLVRGVELTVPVEDDGLSGGTVHLVTQNESLWKIAAKHYGAGHRWGEIYDANRDQLTSPDALAEGMQLLIP